MINRASHDTFRENFTDFLERNRFPRRRWSPRKFSKKFHSIFSLTVDRIPTNIAKREGFHQVSERFRWLARAYTCVYRACTRNDRYDMIIRADAHTHRATKSRACEEEYPIEQTIVVSSFDDWSLLAILGNDFPGLRIFRRGREREEGSSWCAEARHWNRLSLDLYHRAISSPPPPPSVSVFLSLYPLALFFPLLSLRGLPLRVVSLSLSFDDWYRVRAAAEIGWRTGREVSRRRARTVLAGASTSIFLRFIAARLRNASNAVHAA